MSASENGVLLKDWASAYPGPPPFSFPDLAVISVFINVLRRWNDERRAIEALAQLSDERLNDIGLSRGGLERAVRHGLRD